jgi:HD-like signal output (HDOD) protein
MRVLFVDDEQFVLDGLRNALRKQRSRWEMTFVTSGPAALDVLERQSQDVVVSDMRMPGMDGAQLLEQVRARFPETARIVLTGQASQGDMLRALPIAQQILSKPCDPQVLCNAIERLGTVQTLMRNEALKKVVGGLDPVPSFPRCYQQLSEAMERDGVTDTDIVAIVERDPALSARVLSLANTAYFGLRDPTASIHSAVKHVGFSFLRSLALTTEIFSRIPDVLLHSEALKRLPTQSMLRAQLARRYVLDDALADEAFTAGLLLDIGYVVLAKSQPDQYLALLALGESTGQPMHEIESEHLGVTHAEVGAYLLGVWGLPARLCDVVACHHEPALLEVAANPVAAAVHIADVLALAVADARPDPLAGIAGAIRARPEIEARLGEWLSMAQLAGGKA